MHGVALGPSTADRTSLPHWRHRWTCPIVCEKPHNPCIWLIQELTVIHGVRLPIQVSACAKKCLLLVPFTFAGCFHAACSDLDAWECHFSHKSWLPFPSQGGCLGLFLSAPPPEPKAGFPACLIQGGRKPTFHSDFAPQPIIHKP